MEYNRKEKQGDLIVFRGCFPEEEYDLTLRLDVIGPMELVGKRFFQAIHYLEHEGYRALILLCAPLHLTGGIRTYADRLRLRSQIHYYTEPEDVPDWDTDARCVITDNIGSSLLFARSGRITGTTIREISAQLLEEKENRT